MLITASTAMIMPAYWVSTSGKMGSRMRMKPYAPSLSSTPARMTEPAVGAAVCASGSQVWKGHIGTLMAKAAKMPQKARLRTSGSPTFLNRPGNCVKSKVPVWK